MNAWFLVGALLVAFVFGYRFYAKLLALDIFRLDKNYSTPAQSRADGKDFVPTHPHVLFGHHLAAAGGVALFTAPIAAAAWGWVPAFLWILAGSAVAAGTYGLGSFWLSLRHPKGLREVAAELIGRRTRVALFLLALAALVILLAASAGAAAAVLAAYPGAALPLFTIALIALILGSFLHGRAVFELLPASIMAFIACLLAIWLLGGAPLAFNGALTISFGKSVWLTIDAVSVWVVLLLVYVFHAARVPVWRLMRPRAFLTSLLLLVVLVIFYIALGVEHPVLAAPEYHARETDSGTLPWLFLVIGPGALAGWQILITYHVTAREMRRETDAHYVGYGTALGHAVVALSALLIASTGLTDAAQWPEYAKALPSAADLPRLAAFYIEGFTRYASALRLDPLHARLLAATVVIGLALAVLEGAVRAMKHLLAENTSAGDSAPARRSERGRLWAIVIAGGVLAVTDGRGLGGLTAWPLLALLSLWLAAAGFALVACALRALDRSIFIVSALAALAAALAAWGSAVQLWAWWQTSAWILFGAGVAVLLSVALILVEVIGALVRPPTRVTERA